MAGIAFRLVLGRDPEEINRLTEEVGGILNGTTFVLFGAVLLGPVLADVSASMLLYALLSLTVVRMFPVALALLGSRARAPTVGLRRPASFCYGLHTGDAHLAATVRRLSNRLE